MESECGHCSRHRDSTSISSEAANRQRERAELGGTVLAPRECGGTQDIHAHCLPTVSFEMSMKYGAHIVSVPFNLLHNISTFVCSLHLDGVCSEVM